MLDGVYQSAVAFYFLFEIFIPATFATSNGLDIAEYRRMGIYAATTAVCAANIYVLYNTYRWDWLIVTVVVISTLLVWFWTGVYTSFTSSAQFYKSASEVYGNLNFWAYLLCATIACLLPRFIFKVVQKMYFPIDADIIREQVKLGHFDYLRDNKSYLPPPPEKAAASSTSSDAEATKYKAANADIADDDVRPIYPPSVAPTATTHNPRSQNGSGSTDYTFRRSIEGLPPTVPRMSSDCRIRPSYDRARMSMDRVRPSFEASSDFTSAAMLTRMESAHSRNSYGGPPTTQPAVMSRLRNAIRRATITREDGPPDLSDAPAMPESTSPPRSPRSPKSPPK